MNCKSILRSNWAVTSAAKLEEVICAFVSARAILFVLCFLVSLPSLGADAKPALKRGQAAAFLPNGSLLLLGGYDDKNHLSEAVYLVDRSGKASTLASHLGVLRAGASATVLPDGRVLIFGGVGQSGELVAQVEIYDPQTETFSAEEGTGLIPRAYHTATLLTTGEVLIAGGVSAGNAFPDDVQLWDSRTNKTLSFHAFLLTPREGHQASLLADGTVFISEGTDRYGKAVASGEIYDPTTKRFSFVDDIPNSSSSAALQIQASIPEDGATNVSINDRIAIRFSNLINVVSANTKTVQLKRFGSDEQIQATVAAAENGRLAFVTPAQPLEPGTKYTLHIAGIADAQTNTLPETLISFQTKGERVPDEDWNPNSSWTSGEASSAWQKLPPLQAPAGVTALAGQTLRLNGWPLEHVLIEIDHKRTFTDRTGRFLLAGLTSGHHVMIVEGGTAGNNSAAYGFYEIGITILPGRTNVLNYTIWMTKLDMANVVTIPSPTAAETVITSPKLPGLELRIPANTVITDHYGKVVRQISITPVPLDKPPFPLPAVEVPIYFTIQPGGAYINVQNKGAGPKGARLIYPNLHNRRPGTIFDFWNYDPDVKGWFIYGEGKVSGDAKSIVPDPGVMIYEFTGAMVVGGGDGPASGTPAGSGARGGDPVDLSTGLFNYDKTDLVVRDVIPVTLRRTYRPNDSRSRAFGIGTTFDYDMFVVGDTFPYTYQELILPNGGRVRFDRISPGTGPGDAVYVHATAGTKFYGAKIVANTDPNYPGYWRMTLKDGTAYSFPDAFNQTSPFCGALIQITDRYGNKVRIDRASTTCYITKITSPNGRYISFQTDSATGRITSATDNIGRSVIYTYDASGRLHTVQDADSGLWTYEYNDPNGSDRMTSIKDPRNITYLTIEYDPVSGRVTRQVDADNGAYVFNWTASGNGAQSHFSPASSCYLSGGVFDRGNPSCLEGYLPLVSQVDVTDPRGYVRRVVFGPTGYMTSDTHALGQPEQQTTTYEYYYDNTLKSVTDALSRKTSYNYDGKGNLTSIVRLDGTSEAVSTSFTYEPVFNQLASVTDPLTHTTNFSYDPQGNLTLTTDPLGHQTSATYNSAGQIVTFTDPLNHTVQFGYFGPDLNSATDALANVTTQTTDNAGRVISKTDAQGNTTQYQYDGLDLMKQVTDALGNNTVYNYDPNGNLLSVTDANNHAATFTYNNMDRVETKKDGLLRQESYTYDLNGNLSSKTDRKGQVTAYFYDALNRGTSVGFNQVINGGVTSYDSTIAYQYDNGNRMHEAVDSLTGTITREYDDLDRVSSETTPQGSVVYTYDTAGRRSTMTVGGQLQMSYGYDNANRLTNITQGSQSVGFTYDSANRRSTLTLPNGIVATYSYDDGSRLTDITYTLNTTTIGNLSYTYDSLNRRTGITGTLARTALPQQVASASYDAANQLNQWGTSTLTNDPNGNLVSDGASTYGWNSRNQLASITGAMSASFSYDAFGRRSGKVIGAASQSFFYNGENITQELSGTTVTANIWNGGIDEFFQRSDSNGNVVPLSNALGSIVALADSSGNIVTQYTYDPFGSTTMTGVSSTNTFEYTGRENDNTGLYFYRARYYSPQTGRFLSEDPIGFASGSTDLYSYALANPINLMDPFGLWGTFSVGGTVNVTFGFLSFQYSGGIVVDGSGNFGIYNTYTELPGTGMPGVGAGFGNGGLSNLGNLAPSHLNPFGPPAGVKPSGASGGASFGIDFSVAGSTAQNICKLGGTFVNASVGAGAGADVSVDAFAGPTGGGAYGDLPVVGGGATIGVGAGESGSISATNTLITPLFGRKSQTGCPQ
jgi:RHS repeat-associated protein